MDIMEAQIVQISSLLYLKKDVDRNGRDQLEKACLKLNILNNQREEINKQFGFLRDVVDLKLTSMVNWFVDSYRLERPTKVLASHKEADCILFKIESQCILLAFS